MNTPVGLSGQAVGKLSTDQRERLKAVLRQQMPARDDGHIVYEAFANAVKGTVPPS
jgi:hypothetical protein